MTLNSEHNSILILTALPFESRIILNHHNINIKPKKLTTYQLEESIYIIEVPIGFKFNPSILNRQIEKISPKLIINFGICGALESTIPIGSAFCIVRVYHFDKKLSEIKLSEIIKLFQPASLLTVDEAVLNAEQRDELYSETGCRLADMEAFHIALFCKVRRLPLLIVKIASDFADENSLTVIKSNRSVLKRSLTDTYENLMLAI